MKTGQRYLSIIIAFVIFVGMFPANAWAVSEASDPPSNERKAEFPIAKPIFDASNIRLMSDQVTITEPLVLTQNIT